MKRVYYLVLVLGWFGAKIFLNDRVVYQVDHAISRFQIGMDLVSREPDQWTMLNYRTGKCLSFSG